MVKIKVIANKTIRYSKKTYLKGQNFEINKKDFEEMKSAGNISVIPGMKNVDFDNERVENLENELENLRKENKNLKESLDEDIIIPLTYKKLSEMTHDELNKIDETLEVKTEGKKEERVNEIWEKLSDGYEF